MDCEKNTERKTNQIIANTVGKQYDRYEHKI